MKIRARRYPVTRLQRVVRVLLSAAAVAGTTAACRLVPDIHLATLCVLLLLAVLIIASQWDFWEGAVAVIIGDSLLAFFFLPPRGDWHIGDLQYWVVFVTFLTVGISMAHFAARANRLALEALSRSQELERLYIWARALSADGPRESVITQSLDALVRLFGLEDASYYDVASGRVLHAGDHDTGTAIALERMQDVAWGDGSCVEEATNRRLIPIRVAGRVSGSFAIRGDNVSELTFRAMAERLESGLEKSVAWEKSAQAEAARGSQELKSAVLDSLIHEVKTPLSIIKTAVSSLLATNWNEAQGHELLDIIDEEIDRLNATVNEVFWTAHIEAGRLVPAKDPHALRSLIDGTLRELGAELRDRPLRIDVPEPSPLANFDFPMIKGVLKELLKNALKYSPSGSPLAVSVEEQEDDVVVRVADRGIGIAEDEVTRVFEKHYRGKVKASGTGLGLSIAKTIVEAHGGRIGVVSGADIGTSFHFSLPKSVSAATQQACRS